MDYKRYTKYFENIANQHVDINNNPSGGDKAFFRINIEEILTGLKTIQVEKGFCLALINYMYVPGLEGADQLKNVDGGFMVIAKHKTGDFDDETEVIKECERIADEITNRIKYDSKITANDKDSFWYGSQDGISNFSNAIVSGPSFDYIGIQVLFKWKTFYDCTVDPDQWNDLAVLKDPNDWASDVNP